MVRNGWGRVFSTAAVALVFSMVPAVVAWGELPDPFASHWGLNGVPDANLPLAALPLLPLGLVGLGLFKAAIFRTRSGPVADGRRSGRYSPFWEFSR